MLFSLVSMKVITDKGKQCWPSPVEENLSCQHCPFNQWQSAILADANGKWFENTVFTMTSSRSTRRAGLSLNLIAYYVEGRRAWRCCSGHIPSASGHCVLQIDLWWSRSILTMIVLPNQYGLLYFIGVDMDHPRQGPPELTCSRWSSSSHVVARLTWSDTIYFVLPLC